MSFAMAIAKHCPLKQGLRHSCACCIRCTIRCIAKHCPLKQGLRRLFLRRHCYLFQYCKTLSTKTRIATHKTITCQSFNCFNCKTLSTKTRIATRHSPLHRLRGFHIAKHCPLKQGLRHYREELIPLNHSIAKHCPLKQGLRLRGLLFFCTVSLDCKTLSTKTRIATSIILIICIDIFSLQNTVH